MSHPSRPKTVEQMVAEAKERVQNLSVDEVAEAARAGIHPHPLELRGR